MLFVNGVATLPNGKTLIMRNWKHRGKSVGIDDLLADGAKIDADRVERIRKSWPGIQIKYDLNGQVDFSDVAKYKVNVKGMTGYHEHDAKLALAELKKTLSKEEFAELEKNLANYRLHHSTTGEIQVVPADLHTAFAHTGPASFMRKGKDIVDHASVMTYALFAPGLGEIKSRILNDPSTAHDHLEVEIVITGAIDVLRWFDPFFETAYEITEAEIVEFIPEAVDAAEAVDDLRSLPDFQWLDDFMRNFDIFRTGCTSNTGGTSTR